VDERRGRGSEVVGLLIFSCFGRVQRMRGRKESAGSPAELGVSVMRVHDQVQHTQAHPKSQDQGRV